MNTRKKQRGQHGEEEKMDDLYEQVQGQDKRLSALKKKVESLEKQLTKLSKLEMRMVVFEALLQEHCHGDSQASARKETKSESAVEGGDPGISAAMSESSNYMMDESVNDDAAENDVRWRVVEGATYRGRGKLVESTGYVYTVKRERTNSTQWCCVRRNKSILCPALVLEHNGKFTRGRKKHVHPADPSLYASTKPIDLDTPRRKRYQARKLLLKMGLQAVKATARAADTDENAVFKLVENATNRGKGKLVESTGYSYTIKRQNDKGGASQWCCAIRNNKVHCPALVHEKDGVYKRGRRAHAHAPDPAVFTNVKAIEDTPQRARRQAARLLRKTLGLTMSYKSVVRRVPSEPVTDATFEIVDSCTPRGKGRLVESTGYSYTLKCVEGTTTRWWCSVRNNKVRCPASIKECSGVYTRGWKSHSHQPNPDLLSSLKNKASMHQHQGRSDTGYTRGPRDQVHLHKDKHQSATVLEMADSITTQAVESLLKQEHHQESPSQCDHDYPVPSHQEDGAFQFLDDGTVSRKSRLGNSTDYYTIKEVPPGGVDSFTCLAEDQEMLDSKLGVLPEAPLHTDTEIPQVVSEAVASLTPAQLAQIASITGQASGHGSDVMYMYVVDDGTAVLCNQPTPLQGGSVHIGHEQISKDANLISASPPSTSLPQASVVVTAAEDNLTCSLSVSGHPVTPLVKPASSTSSAAPRVIRVMRPNQSPDVKLRQTVSAPTGKSREGTLAGAATAVETISHLCHQCGMVFADSTLLQNHSLIHGISK